MTSTARYNYHLEMEKNTYIVYGLETKQTRSLLCIQCMDLNMLCVTLETLVL